MTASSYELNIIDFCIDVMFFIDIIVTFNTLYYSDKDMAYIGNRRFIAQKYFKSWFILDLASSLPFADFTTLADPNINVGNLAIIRLMKVLRMIRLFKIMKQFDFSKLLIRAEEYFNINPAFLRLLTTIFQVSSVDFLP
jgi:hypothetical protein